MSLFPVYSPAPPIAAVSFVTTVLDTVNRSTYTFSGASLGVAAADRKIVIATGSVGQGEDLTGVSVGGVTAELVIESATSGSDQTALWQADVPTGTTGDVVLTLSGSVSVGYIGIYRVVGAGTGPSAAHATDFDVTNSAAMPLALDCPANGIIIGCSSNAANTSLNSWVGITEDFDETTEGTRSHTGASDAFAAIQSALDCTVTPVSPGTETGAVAASWGPA